MDLELGHSHPDFTYSNDQRQAKLALLLTAFSAVVLCALIIQALV